MKNFNFNDFECQPLSKEEFSLYNGGTTPSSGTSFANDAAYFIVYGACALWDGIRAFGAGAAKGQSLRFSG